MHTLLTRNWLKIYQTRWDDPARALVCAARRREAAVAANLAEA